MQLKMLNSIVTIRLWQNYQGKCCRDLDPTPTMLNTFRNGMYNDIKKATDENENEEEILEETLGDIEKRFDVY
jgi:hypothetical protein